MSESGRLSGDVIPRSQERAAKPLKLELQVAVSHLIWNQSQGLWRSSRYPSLLRLLDNANLPM